MATDNGTFRPLKFGGRVANRVALLNDASQLAASKIDISKFNIITSFLVGEYSMEIAQRKIILYLFSLFDASETITEVAKNDTEE